MERRSQGRGGKGSTLRFVSTQVEEIPLAEGVPSRGPRPTLLLWAEGSLGV